MKELELRMYGLVIYQLSGIQKGIQFGHAGFDYGQSAKFNGIEIGKYDDWANNWKTVILLNGGTTNTNPTRLGTLNQHFQTLKDNLITCTPFYEPDLGDQLTAVAFIVDERVFNREKYPDFDLTPFYGGERLNYSEIYKDPMNPVFPNCRMPAFDDTGLKAKKAWKKWVKSMGDTHFSEPSLNSGRRNLFLREFLKPGGFKLA